MALPITVPYTFGNATAAIPLTNLDSDFTTITNAVNGIGNGTVALANANITGVAVTFPNNFLSNSSVTLGNTSVALGSTVGTVGNLTTSNLTVTGYQETVVSTTGNVTINVASSTFQYVNVNAATTITLPTSVAGKSFTVEVYYSSNSSVTWAGGSTLKWAGGVTPTPTATTGKYDIFNFYQDGTNTFGAVFGQSF